MRAATGDQTGAVYGLASSRGLGWVRQPNPLWVPADLCSPEAYSHTGFTGTSLLVDPATGIFAVLLTNRVHPTRGGDSPQRIRALRALEVTRFAAPCRSWGWPALPNQGLVPPGVWLGDRERAP